MEEQGIVGPADGAKPRQVLVTSVDDVFGGQQAAEAVVPQTQPVPAIADQGDVYDDMPDE
jgi:hypothetical protein